MKLSFHQDTSPRFPAGYWYAVTDDGGYDGAGLTPLDAVSALVTQMEEEE